MSKKIVAPKKIKVGGVVYEKLPEKIRVGGTIYVLAVKGRGLGTPTGKLAKPSVAAPSASKGNSKQVPLPTSTDTAYLKGKGKK